MTGLSRRGFLASAALATTVTPTLRPRFAKASAPAPEATLVVDARAATERVVRTQLRFPAEPGPFALVYPKWLPGEHAPTGRIEDVVGLVISVAGKSIPWRRDSEAMYEFSCLLPEGTKSVDVALEYVTGTGGRGSDLPSVASQKLYILKWNHVLLYPKGADPRSYRFAASVRLPAGWSFATALPVKAKTSDGAQFAPVSLETLIDSPLASGAFARTIDLTPAGGPPHELNLFGESREALAIKDAAVVGYRRLVTEAHALFGGWPYARYRFLLSLSDYVPHGGLEHHESSDNRVPEKTLIDDAAWSVRAGLLPHEHVHCWNGKLRRPRGLATRDYQEPMKTELLWVYEGLTTYLGETLTARAGLRTPEEVRESLAHTAATLDARAGRKWRPLGDTAVSAPMLTGATRAWRGWRRGLDYYPEAQLIWLEADVLIRQKTGGKKSFDDFCKQFHGRHSRGTPAVVPYDLAEVVTTLNEICPNDWAGFFKARVDAVTPRAPLEGIKAGGWRLVYGDKPSGYQRRIEQANKEIDHSFSLGIVLREDGGLTDVLPGSAAAKAGIAPLGVVVAVNGRKFARDRLAAAIAATKTEPGLELLVESQEVYRTHKIAWREGLRYPTLERESAAPDLLSAIWAPRAQA